jgi:hypothetical protein
MEVLWTVLPVALRNPVFEIEKKFYDVPPEKIERQVCNLIRSLKKFGNVVCC